MSGKRSSFNNLAFGSGMSESRRADGPLPFGSWSMAKSRSGERQPSHLAGCFTIDNGHRCWRRGRHANDGIMPRSVDPATCSGRRHPLQSGPRRVPLLSSRIHQNRRTALTTSMGYTAQRGRQTIKKNHLGSLECGWLSTTSKTCLTGPRQ